MNEFKNFNIKPVIESFIGDKIKFEKILNQEIIVEKYRIGPSKYEGIRLDIQIIYKGEHRITWTSGKYIIQTIEQIPKDNFPFKTTILKVDDHFEFT